MRIPNQSKSIIRKGSVYGGARGRVAPSDQGAFVACNVTCDAGLAACLAGTFGLGAPACIAAAAACHGACQAVPH